MKITINEKEAKIILMWIERAYDEHGTMNDDEYLLEKKLEKMIPGEKDES